MPHNRIRRRNSTSGSNFDTCLRTRIFLYMILRNFSQMTRRAMTVPNDLLTRPSSLCLSQWAKCRPGNTGNDGTILSIANLMAGAASGSVDFYSSFLVTVRLSRLVLEIFACDRRTDGQTPRTITILGPHTVAGHLIMCKDTLRTSRLSLWYLITATYNASKKTSHF